MSGKALAEPPSNDTIAGATPASIGFSQVLDTTQATTDSDDTQLNASCGAPATDASVWYAFTVASDTTVVVDVSQSNYSAGVLVGVGDRGNLSTIACGPYTVGFYATAGTTYYVLAIDYQGDGGGNGGSLNISFNEVVAPTVDITVNRFGQVDAHTGIATISGTYTCSHGNYFSASINARQTVGRFVTLVGSGYFDAYEPCDERPHPWSADIVPQSGKFAGGKSMTVTSGYTCGPFQCANGYVQQTVQLRGGPTN